MGRQEEHMPAAVGQQPLRVMVTSPALPTQSGGTGDGSSDEENGPQFGETLHTLSVDVGHVGRVVELRGVIRAALADADPPLLWLRDFDTPQLWYQGADGRG